MVSIDLIIDTLIDAIVSRSPTWLLNLTATEGVSTLPIAQVTGLNNSFTRHMLEYQVHVGMGLCLSLYILQIYI